MNYAEKKRIELICDIDDSVPSHIIGDTTRIRQILVNLLNNACKFSSSGDIIVTARATLIPANEPENYPKFEITFSVKDQGIGITEEAKSRILTPFMQADISIARKFGGTGLGLVICKHLVELMEGRLWFESKVGEGSNFYFSIVTTSPKPLEKPPKQVNVSGRIAVIAHSEGLTNYIKGTLESNFRVFVDVFKHASAFYHHQNHYNCIVVDNEELTAELEKKAGKLLLVLVNHTFLKKILYIRKPVRKESLLHAVRCKMLGIDIIPEDNLLLNVGKSEQITSDLRILVAEDNPLNQQLVKKILESIGYPRFTIVCNGMEAVNAAESESFDVILMDVMMPVMDGEEATRIIRSKGNSKVPIFAMTATVNLSRYEALGFNGMIAKPIDRSKLKEILQSISTTEPFNLR